MLKVTITGTVADGGSFDECVGNGNAFRPRGLLLFPVLLNQPEESTSQKQVSLHPLQPSFLLLSIPFGNAVSSSLPWISNLYPRIFETSISIPEEYFVQQTFMQYGGET